MKNTFIEDYILNKIKQFTLVVLVQGEMQMGKSTFVRYLMENLSKLKFNKSWNYKEFCARNFEEFVRLVDKYDNQLIVFEEASKDISVDKWFNDLNFFFNIILQTQAYKHNLYIIVFPWSLGVSKRQRRFIKLGIEVIEKNEEYKWVLLKPTIYSRTYWRLDDDDIQYYFPRFFDIKYSENDLKMCKEYTDWLIETLKKETMKDIKKQIKLRKRKQEILNQDFDIEPNLKYRDKKENFLYEKAIKTTKKP